HEELARLQGAGERRQRRLPRGRARRPLASHGDPRREDRELPAVPADAVERELARRVRDARAVRGLGAEHADLRGERARHVQGHRHHAGRPVVRPVPAVRRAHVPRRREGEEGRPHSDRSLLMAATDELPVDDPELLLGDMLDLHGEGLARILEALAAAPALRDGLVSDPVVASMLLVHGLHPVPLEERVGAALDRVRPYLASHGGNVELLGLEDGVAHLLLKGSCHGCAASASTLELAIERALEEEAPDLLGLEVEGAVDRGGDPSGPLPLAVAPSWSRWTLRRGRESCRRRGGACWSPTWRAP